MFSCYQVFQGRLWTELKTETKTFPFPNLCLMACLVLCLGKRMGTRQDHSGKSRVTYRTRALELRNSPRMNGTIDKRLDLTGPGSTDQNSEMSVSTTPWQALFEVLFITKKETKKKKKSIHMQLFILIPCCRKLKYLIW